MKTKTCEHSWIQDAPIKVCFHCGFKPTPPVNESWEVEAQNWMDKLSIIDLRILNNIVFHKVSTARQEAITKSKEELLRWITKTANKSAMAGVGGYDFVHRLEEKLKAEIYTPPTTDGGKK